MTVEVQPSLAKEGVNRVYRLLIKRHTVRFGPIGMEQLWNTGGATGG